MSNVINKKDLAEKLAEEFGCSKKDATAYVQFVFDTVADTLKDNGTVDVPVETPNTDSSDPLGLGEGQDNPYAGIDFSQYGEMPSYEDAMNDQCEFAY